MKISVPNPVHLLRAKLLCTILLAMLLLVRCSRPDEAVVLRQIKDVLVDASTDPMLRANAVFYNPNNTRGKLKRIQVKIFVNGKMAATVDQHLKTLIPAKKEFSIPLEVKLSMKELGFMDTLLGVLGGKRFEIRYEGTLKLTYHGIPFQVPVNYKDEVRIRF